MKSNLNIKTILIMAIIGIISLVFFNKSFAANTAKVTVDTANIRKSADVNSTLVEQVNKDQEVEILEKTGDWYKIKFNGIIGYLRKDLLNVDGETTTENTTTENTEPTATEETQNTQTNTQTATESKEESVEETKVYTCKENIKLKIMPLINGNDIKEITQNSKVNVLEINNKWALVESESVRGWVLLSKIEKEDVIANSTEEAKEQEQEENKDEEDKEETEGPKTEETQTEETQPEEVKTEETQSEEPKAEEQTTYVEKTMYVNSEVINLRAEGTTDSESLARLTKATEVKVVSETNGWSKVKVNGTDGYILSTLLSDRKPEVTTSRNSEEQRTKKSTNKSEKATSSSGSATGSAIVDKARSYIGCKYTYGGSSPSGFDCSGFSQYIYKQFGVNINRTAASQYSNGKSVSKSDLQLGDLVMFGSSASNINHVGIYAGNGTIVHAANPSRGVTTDTINSGYYNNNYVGARRIVN